MIGKPSYKTEVDYQMAGLAGGGMVSEFTFIPSNDFDVRTGYYSKADLGKLIRSAAKRPATIRYIADMME